MNGLLEKLDAWLATAMESLRGAQSLALLVFVADLVLVANALWQIRSFSVS